MYKTFIGKMPRYLQEKYLLCELIPMNLEILKTNCLFLSHEQIVLNAPSASVEQCWGTVYHRTFVQRGLQAVLKEAWGDGYLPIFTTRQSCK